MICFRTPLHAAAFTDHVECLQLLLSHNAQVNAVDASGKTPLMMAAENGQTNTVGKVSITAVQCVDLTMDELALSADFVDIFCQNNIFILHRCKLLKLYRLCFQLIQTSISCRGSG